MTVLCRTTTSKRSPRCTLRWIPLHEDGDCGGVFVQNQGFQIAERPNRFRKRKTVVNALRCTSWIYRNVAGCAGYRNATLLEYGSLAEQCHKVSFWGDNNEEATRWHGSFSMNPRKTMMLIMFNCHGDPSNLHRVLLCRVHEAPDIYFGFDYLGRPVELTLQEVYMWDDGEGKWI